MTIYNFNHGIGWASSGVEYAQAYRSKIFRNNHQQAKFIFTDIFHENLATLTQNIGFKNHEIIWLYQFFTDIKVSSTLFDINKLEAQFPTRPTLVEKNKQNIIYKFSDTNLRVIAYFDHSDKLSENNKIYKTEWIVGEKLIQRDYYNYVKIYSEYFKPVNNQANLYQRRFFNEDGSIAYDELMNGEQSLFIFEDRTIYSKQELIVYFIERLKLTNKDILIIDRSTNIGPQIIKAKGKAKVGVVIHAEHFNELLTTSKKILWNNYYDYQFENARAIDFFITATHKQKTILEQQFHKYNKGSIKVYAIPVGSIDQLKKKTRRKSHSIITASRLASEKHLDWLIRAVVMARKEIKDLTLDIYGRGGEEGNLRELISKLGAKEYIHLMGQHDLTNIYSKYQTYVSTSTSEGFGLTLLEAVGSGLGMIGFDVRYGSQTFIKDSQNGYLVDYIKNDVEKNISQISEAIVKMNQQEKKELQKMREKSYEIAENFMTKKIQEQWRNLEGEVIID
ncbi:accessory Sec system glycosyltransferase GtfA [Enterococcus mundtii]|uniref:UDP-N-acetylglucosamine--peptide N-acetylglucosaminyltransferase GtfA subunit n=1 Tax=Enterococcus mundtii TaxID=53346 RepID=A0A242KUE1_ENTMU|nr:accessory Sec system glycosyltransferase GtfA [Enterococcus mundtii]OTP24833.1 accessory Sec system glycosylation protein GtfA [Enterococcus mundtii]